MKEFLFSRFHKQHYSNAVVRMGKNNLGFSLVELVIVIAIMAILAAVAIPVLGVFIEKSKISNDQNTVYDIINSIEMAVDSGLVTIDDGMSMSAFKYPVAFVVVNDEGTQVITSNAQPATSNSSCTMVTKEVFYLEEVAGTKTCTKADCNKTWDCTNYKLSSQTLTYCESHANVKTVAEGEVKYVVAQYQEHGSLGWHTQAAASTENAVPAGSNFSSDISKVTSYGEYKGSGGCVAGSYNGLENVGSIDSVSADSPVYQAIAATYGSDFGQKLKLNYEWDSTEGVGYAPLFTAAPQLMQDVKDMATGVVAASNHWGSTLSLLDIQNYNSTDELMTTFADEFINKYGPNVVDANGNPVGLQNWYDVWSKCPGLAWTDGGFGFSYREQFSACRFAYNSSFAAYLTTCGIASTYTNIVKDFSRDLSKDGGMKGTIAKWMMDSYGIQYPATITRKAFTDDASGLKEQFKAAGDTDGKVFERVQELYETYVTSDAFLENAKAFYDTMVTVDETKVAAGTGDDFFAYYDTYLNEMSSLYTIAQQKAGENGVVIIVYAENGVVSCDVTPSAADPRNK